MPVSDQHISIVDRHRELDRDIKRLELLILNCENMLREEGDPDHTTMHLAFIAEGGDIHHTRLPSDVCDELVITLKIALSNKLVRLKAEIDRLTIEE